MKSKKDEFYGRIVMYDSARAKVLKKRLVDNFIKLRIKVKTKKDIELTEIIKMSEELIELCESKYGRDFEQLDSTNLKKIENLYQIVNDFLYEIEKEKKETIDEQIL